MPTSKAQRGRVPRNIRLAIQQSDKSAASLARTYGLNPKTVLKWRKRGDVNDRPSGPPPGRRRSLSAAESEIIVRFRKHTQLPLDDCLYALQAQIPHLTRATLHRCFQRHAISPLNLAGKRPLYTDHHPTPVPGQFDLDAVRVTSANGTCHVFKAMESYSKFVFVQIYKDAEICEYTDFLASVLSHYPGKVHLIRTGTMPEDGPDNPFTRLCHKHGATHAIALGSTPKEKAGMEQLITDIVTFPSTEYIEQFLNGFVHAYNFKRRLKKLGGQTPFDLVHKAWRANPQDFPCEPDHKIMRLEITPAWTQG